MVATAPFPGLLYNPERIQDLSQVIAPPYDVINPEEQERCYQRHDQNIIRLELGKELPGDSSHENRYTRAQRFLNDWRKDRFLLRDPAPAYYFYRIDYKTLSGESKTVKGFFGLVRLEDYSPGGISPHEETFSQPKADRLSLLRACRANLSPIFGLYSDPSHAILEKIETVVDSTRPGIDLVDHDGIRHRLWKIQDPPTLRYLTQQMEKKAVLIADGHHRYETARTFHREEDSEASGWVLMYLSPIEDTGLTILPTHRVLSGLPIFEPKQWLHRLGADFQLTGYPFTARTQSSECQHLLEEMAKGGKSNHRFGLFISGVPAFHLLTIRSNHPVFLESGIRRAFEGQILDVDILNKILLPDYIKLADPSRHLQFVKNASEAIRLVEGGAQCVFLLNPPTIEDIRALSDAGERMPQKTSYFYPKPLTGLVIRLLD